MNLNVNTIYCKYKKCRRLIASKKGLNLIKNINIIMHLEVFLCSHICFAYCELYC